MNHVWNAENLFHYKAEQTKYSIKPEHYGKLPGPLFLDDKETNTYLNEFFFFVFSKVGDWQCLKELAVGRGEDALSLAQSGYCALSKSLSGPALEQCPVISKKTVAYFESFLGAAPFPRIQKDPRLDTRIDKYYASAMARLAKTTDKDFIKYIERKLVAWFRRFPAKNDPDQKKKDEVDDRMGGALDDTVHDDGEDQGLDPSDEEGTESAAAV